MSHWYATGFGVVATLSGASAFGQVTLGALTRYIEAHASAQFGGGGPTVHHDGSGYGLFNDQVSVAADDPGAASGSGLANQMSIVQPVGDELQFSISGRVTASGFGPMSAGSGSGYSVAILDFMVTQSVPWRLITNMTQSTNLAFQIATSRLERLSPGAATIADHSYWFGGPQTSGGFLAPGSYRFTADFRTGSQEEGSAALNFSVLLAIPSVPSVGVPMFGALFVSRRRRA